MKNFIFTLLILLSSASIIYAEHPSAHPLRFAIPLSILGLVVVAIVYILIKLNTKKNK